MLIHELKNAEVQHFKNSLKRTVRLCLSITANMESIALIKTAIKEEDLSFASQLLHELNYSDQNLLLTAPSKGGCFTTQERKVLTELWEVKLEDYEHSNTL